jgi:hypothetical protein
VTNDTFLALMENIVLLHVPVGTIFSLNGAPLLSSHCVHTFQDREFPDHWIGRGRPIPWSSCSPDLTPLVSFFCGFLKSVVLSWKSAKCEWIAWQNHQSWRVHYQWNACQHLVRKWILSWCVLCHLWCPYWDLVSTEETLHSPVFENALISPIQFIV